MGIQSVITEFIGCDASQSVFDNLIFNTAFTEFTTKFRYIGNSKACKADENGTLCRFQLFLHFSDNSGFRRRYAVCRHRHSIHLLLLDLYRLSNKIGLHACACEAEPVSIRYIYQFHSLRWRTLVHYTYLQSTAKRDIIFLPLLQHL